MDKVQNKLNKNSEKFVEMTLTAHLDSRVFSNVSYHFMSVLGKRGKHMSKNFACSQTNPGVRVQKMLLHKPCTKQHKLTTKTLHKIYN